MINGKKLHYDKRSFKVAGGGQPPGTKNCIMINGKIKIAL